jgi:hypothetical protein
MSDIAIKVAYLRKKYTLDMVRAACHADPLNEMNDE